MESLQIGMDWVPYSEVFLDSIFVSKIEKKKKKERELLARMLKEYMMLAVYIKYDIIKMHMMCIGYIYSQKH